MAVEALLDAGNPIEARNKFRNRPLNLAALRGQLSVVELLVERGADINGDGNEGWTPLHREDLSTINFGKHMSNKTNRCSRK